MVFPVREGSQDLSIVSSESDEEDDNVDVQGALVSALHEVEETSSWYSCLCSRTTRIAFWTISLVGTLTTTILSETLLGLRGTLGRVAHTFLPLGSGFSLGYLLSSLPSRNVVNRLRLEAWRLGIPLYFLMTQLYLNADDEEEKKWLIDMMMGLWGLQLSTLIDQYVTHHFKAVVLNNSIPLINESGPEGGEEQSLVASQRRFTLVTDYTPTIRGIKFIVMGLFGTGMVVSSFFIENSDGSHILLNFGSFYVAESVITPLWERVELWGHGLEEEFEKRLEMATTRIEPGRKLKAFRVLKRTLELGLPLSIAGCFYYPKPWTLALAGGMHGVNDELSRFPFTHVLVSKIQSVRRRVFNQGTVCRVIDTTYLVARVGAETFALAYFSYLVFRQGDQVDNLAIGTFLATTVTGYVSTVLVDRVFSPMRSSPLMQTIFFRMTHSPEILGIDPLYIYYYTVNYPIDIGSGSLSSISSGQGIIAFVSWGSYGWRLGQDLALYESGRNEPAPARISRWLMFSNLTAFIQELEGVIS